MGVVYRPVSKTANWKLLWTIGKYVIIKEMDGDISLKISDDCGTISVEHGERFR